MTIGNLSSNVRMKPTSHSILLITLLPRPIKLRDVPMPQRVEQRIHDHKVMQSVLGFLVYPLINQDTREVIGYCADRQHRKCHLILSAWVADYPEHVVLQNHGYGLCPWYEITQNKLGDQINTSVLPRDHILYQALYNIAKHDRPDSASLAAIGDMEYSKDITEHSSLPVENRSSIISSITEIIRNISNDPIEAASILKQHGMNLGDNIF
jgi:hypothetical protein